MAVVPTIKVQSGDRPEGWILINLSDFDGDRHVPYEGAGASAPAGGTAQPGPELLSLRHLTLTELRGLASEEKIRGRSSMDEEELLQALQDKGYEL